MLDDNALSVNINRIREKLTGIGLTDLSKQSIDRGTQYEPQTVLEK